MTFIWILKTLLKIMMLEEVMREMKAWTRMKIEAAWEDVSTTSDDGGEIGEEGVVDAVEVPLLQAPAGKYR